MFLVLSWERFVTFLGFVLYVVCMAGYDEEANQEC